MAWVEASWINADAYLFAMSVENRLQGLHAADSIDLGLPVSFIVGAPCLFLPERRTAKNYRSGGFRRDVVSIGFL